MKIRELLNWILAVGQQHLNHFQQRGFKRHHRDKRSMVRQAHSTASTISIKDGANRVQAGTGAGKLHPAAARSGGRRLIKLSLDAGLDRDWAGRLEGQGQGRGGQLGGEKRVSAGHSSLI